jgi:hypothetical protein
MRALVELTLDVRDHTERLCPEVPLTHLDFSEPTRVVFRAIRDLEECVCANLDPECRGAARLVSARYRTRFAEAS